MTTDNGIGNDCHRPVNWCIRSEQSDSHTLYSFRHYQVVLNLAYLPARDLRFCAKRGSQFYPLPQSEEKHAQAQKEVTQVPGVPSARMAEILAPLGGRGTAL